MGGSVADSVTDPGEGEFPGTTGTGEGGLAHVELRRELLLGVELGDVGDGVHAAASTRTALLAIVMSKSRKGSGVAARCDAERR